MAIYIKRSIMEEISIRKSEIKKHKLEIERINNIDYSTLSAHQKKTLCEVEEEHIRYYEGRISEFEAALKDESFTESPLFEILKPEHTHFILGAYMGMQRFERSLRYEKECDSCGMIGDMDCPAKIKRNLIEKLRLLDYNDNDIRTILKYLDEDKKTLTRGAKKYPKKTKDGRNIVFFLTSSRIL